MRLRYKREVKNKQIALEVEATNFTKQELSALSKLGEPIIKLEQSYNGGHGISIERRLGPKFKIKVRLDGTKDIDTAIKATNEFLEDLQLLVEKKMECIMDKHDMIQDEFENTQGYIDIDY